MQDNNDGKGSGLFYKLRPGEKLRLKDSNYLVRNLGQFTADLQFLTVEQDTAWEENRKKRARFVEVDMTKTSADNGVWTGKVKRRGGRT